MTLVQAIKKAAKWYEGAQEWEDFEGITIYKWKDGEKGWNWSIGRAPCWAEKRCIVWLTNQKKWKAEEIEESTRNFYKKAYTECTRHFKK